MINFKKEIAKNIADAVDIKQEEISEFLEVPKDLKNGDYAFPCFRLAKILKKSPQQIATEIQSSIKIDVSKIEKVEVISGYLNFYINKKLQTKEVIKQISEKDEYGKCAIGEGKNIIVEYSSPNIAKPFHIGHLRNTVIRTSII